MASPLWIWILLAMEHLDLQNNDFLIEPDHFLKIDALDGYALMKALSLQRMVLGGSDGGVSTTILAALYPDSIQKLVIWGSNAYAMKHDIELFEKTSDVSDWSQQMEKQWR